jgi:hypothetical protein
VGELSVEVVTDPYDVGLGGEVDPGLADQVGHLGGVEGHQVVWHVAGRVGRDHRVEGGGDGVDLGEDVSRRVAGVGQGGDQAEEFMQLEVPLRGWSAKSGATASPIRAAYSVRVNSKTGDIDGVGHHLGQCHV